MKKYNFHSLFYCFNYDKKMISLKEFDQLILLENFPDYLNIYKKNDSIICNINSDIYIKALNKMVAFDVQNNSLKLIMEKNIFLEKLME